MLDIASPFFLAVPILYVEACIYRHEHVIIDKSGVSSQENVALYYCFVPE